MHNGLTQLSDLDLDALLADLDADADAIADGADASFKANYGARMGQVIAGRLVRGQGGRFSSGGAAPTRSSEALVREAEAEARRLTRSSGGRGRSGPGKGKGKGRKPAKTTEQRQAEKAQQQEQNRAEVFGSLGLAEDATAALLQLAAGDQVADDGGLVAMGLAVRDGEGQLRLTPQGRALLTAANRGDAGRARDALSLGKDRAAAAAERERRKQEKQGKGGGGGSAKKPGKEEQRAENRQRVAEQMAEQNAGLSKAALDAFLAFADGGAGDSEGTQHFASLLSAIAKQTGLLDTSADGGQRLSKEGRAFLRALDKGDTRAALDTLSRAREKRQEEQVDSDETTRKAAAIDGDDESEDEPHPGAMIAFLLSDEDAEALCDACGEVEDADPDHLTLVYLAPDASDLEAQKNNLVGVLAGLAAGTAPIAGRVNGYGRFSGDEGDGTSALYANFDSPALPSFRERLMEAAQFAGIRPVANHGFMPHITLSYLDIRDETPHLELPDLAITFDRIALVWAGETLTFPLGGSLEPEAGGVPESDALSAYTAPFKAGALAAETDATAPFASIKALAERTIEIKVAFGGPFKGRDSHGEYFSPNTDFDIEHFPTPPITYYHGFDEHGKPMQRPIFIGSTVKRETRADGHYLTGKLRDGKYADLAWKAALEGRAVASPGTIHYLRRRQNDGHLDYWPIAEISVWDDDGRRRPANPLSIAVPALSALKSLYHEAGIDLPALIAPSPEAPPEAPVETGAAGAATGTPVQTQYLVSLLNSPTEDINVTPEEIQNMVAQGVQEALKAQQDALAAAEQARKDEEAKIAAAVSAAQQQWEANAAKGRRLPDAAGHSARLAPYVTAFHGTRKYDHLDIDDMAFLAGTLDSFKRRYSHLDGLSTNAAKALALRIAEDKSPLGEEARSDLKAAGLDPQDVTSAAKANELNYSTQSGYGDEWVGVEYSRRLWEAIRAGTFVLQKLPSVEVPQGVESITIPLESTDPTWYKVGQSTAIDGTTGRPNASVTASKVATANKSLTVGKVGARVVYAGEMDEDSLIPWVSQLRKQLEQSGAEQIEHLVIDGDSETGATTNINDIGGTPGGSELFLTFSGFRKLALVTNTANSRSASGSLVDTDFLETLKLMGTAGLNGADRTKVEFIIDANVMWKVMQLLSVKTRDVFQQATLENGMFAGIWGYKVNTSYFMHYLSSVRKANTSGKVDQDTTANNTTGAILSVRWDQWLLGYKRRIKTELERLLDSDSHQIVAFARLGMVARDNEAAAESYNVGI